ncbi:hypothetical protein [Lysinibacillus boronitolerans]|nr:hypothetical protein [Lysinibacillus boronitolerans]
MEKNSVVEKYFEKDFKGQLKQMEIVFLWSLNSALWRNMLL